MPPRESPFRVRQGQSVRFTLPLTVLGTVPSPLPSTVTLTIEPPAGAPDAAIVDASPTYGGLDDQGRAYYFADVVIPAGASPGFWVRYWQATGAAPSQNATSNPRLVEVVPLTAA